MEEKSKRVSIENLLPLGSIVTLKGSDKKVMITCFYVLMEESDKGENKENVKKKKLYDYMGILWPEGDIDAKTKILFDHEAISEVYFYGYTNDEFIEFKNLLRKSEHELDDVEHAQIFNPREEKSNNNE